MTLLPLFILLVLVAINALYVAAEFAAVSVSRARLQQMADEGSAMAARILPTITDPASLDRYVAACQIGITASSLVLGAYGQVTLSSVMTPMLVDYAGMQEISAKGLAAIIILILLTIFQMILGELLPKSLALQFPTKAVLSTATAMLFSLRVFSPFIRLLNGSGLLVLRLFGVPQTSHRHVHSAEEMGLLFSESHEGGLIESQEHERLEQALQLGNRKVAEIMVPRTQICAIDLKSTYESILETMAAHPYTRWPVFDDSVDNIVGIVHARDVAKLALDRSKRFDLRRVMRTPLVVHEGMAADHLLSVMRIEHKQLAIVVDEFGITLGVVGISDVLDELMGDIFEGRSPESDQVETLADGRVRLPGTLRLFDATAWMGREWKSDNAVTVAGRILEALGGTMPHPGDTFEIEGVKGVIDRVNLRAIETVLISPIVDELHGAEDSVSLTVNHD